MNIWSRNLIRATDNMPEEKDGFMPAIGQTYYRVAGNGLVSNPAWKGSKRDMARYEFGNCFEKYGDALDAQMLIKRLLQRLKKKNEK